MGAIQGKVFKSGNSAAVRLPKELGLDIGTLITIRKDGDRITIEPTEDPEDIRRDLREMGEQIAALWAAAGGPPEPEVREPIEFPERPGL
ncbi:MAG TPA: AbrB/MazE/SpoVT family DNA-binding domain-containing protein [Sphingomonas sp.]|jgi:antitoxin VapB